MINLKILYEDNHIIAVYKPAGILVQGDFSGKKSLMDYIKDYLKEKYKKPGNVFLSPVHRIDRPVSGIVLFAKTSKGASRLSEQFRGREIEKTYHAIVIGLPEKQKGTVTNFIKKVSFFAQAYVDEKNFGHQDKSNEKGKKAELYYEVKQSNGRYSLLEVRPTTGRFHQIRIQLASMGYPILGDVKYGAPFALKDKSICLCATSIVFRQATSEENKKITISIPKEWAEISDLEI